MIVKEQIKVIAISNFWVDISPKTTSTIADYSFHVTLEKKLGTFDWMHLYFPKGTTFHPPLPDDEVSRKKRAREIQKYITVDSDEECEKCFGVAIYIKEDGQIKIAFDYPFHIDPSASDYKETIIHISKDAGIITPSTPGSYQYKIATVKEPKLVDSQPVEITETENDTKKKRIIMITIGSNKAIVNDQIIRLDDTFIPILKNGSTFVSVRFMGEIVCNNKAKFEYITSSRSVTFEIESKKINFFVDQHYAQVNGNQMDLNTPCFIDKGRVFVPLRFLAENIDIPVGYDTNTKSISLCFLENS